jgi:hypothetical protein
MGKQIEYAKTIAPSGKSMRSSLDNRGLHSGYGYIDPNLLYEDESYVDYAQKVVLPTDYLSDEDISGLSGDVVTYYIEPKKK